MIRSIVVVAMLAVSISANTIEEPVGQTAAAPRVNSLYAHPLALVFTTALPNMPKYLSCTYERDLGEKKALIVKPMVLLMNGLKMADTISYSNIDTIDVNGFSIQVGVGLRRYLSRPSSGIYLQVMTFPGFGSIDMKRRYDGDEASGSGLVLPILGYLGYKGLFDVVALDLNLGVGYNLSRVTTKQKSAGSLSHSGTGLAVGGSFGMGLVF